jgi:hypothetical protein
LGTIKVENMLAVRDASGTDHFIYPYFAEAPLLGQEAARLGLWVLREAFPDHRIEDMGLLDVMRGQTFTVEALPLRGDEEAILRSRYAAMLEQWRALREEYP